MITILFILIICAIFLFYWPKKGKGQLHVHPEVANVSVNHPVIAADGVVKSISGIKEDEDGRRYREVLKEGKSKRCTYLRGRLSGKYWGEVDRTFSSDFKHAQFYDFCIYEVSVVDVSFAEEPFIAINDSRFPREKLPEKLPVQLEKDGNIYEVNVHEPIFSSVLLNRKLHQQDGVFVFGTIEAELSGYLIDFVPNVYTEREYILDTPEPHTSLPIQSQENKALLTGRIERSGVYKRLEYYEPNHDSRYWGKWMPDQKRVVQYNGPLTSGFDILAAIFGIAFLLFLIPQILFLLPFILVPIILSFFSRSLHWGIGFVSVLTIFLFLWAIYHRSTEKESRPSTNRTTVASDPVATTPGLDHENRGVIVNQAELLKQARTRIPDSKEALDTLIRHRLTWQGYAGEAYSGEYSVSASQYLSSREFKQAQEPLETPLDYSRLVYRIGNHDAPFLVGLYSMFDSIGNANQLNARKFAEMIVSCVQQIPYALILPTACDANLYQDEFITRYLAGSNSKCVGSERFGLNTPVEFLTTLNGDCDTRSLLIYSVLSYYNYDVAMFNSIHYKHALIGINLPFSGLYYRDANKKYVLWETTATGFKPGLLPAELSDTRHWTITLQSK